MSSTFICAMGALLVGGCTTIGDFGRPKESSFMQELSTQYELIQQLVDPTTYKFVLSREEMDIRKAAYHFHRSLPTPLVPQQIAFRIVEGHSRGLSSYAHSHTSRRYADGNARAGEIDEMLAADHVWAKRLEQAGKRVRSADRERLYILEDRAAPFSHEDRIATHARIEENANVLLSALQSLDKRLSAYHYAVERTRLEWPVTPLQRTQSSLDRLRATAARLRVALGFDGTGFSYEEVEVIAPVAGGSITDSKYSGVAPVSAPTPARDQRKSKKKNITEGEAAEDNGVGEDVLDPGSKSFSSRK